ncbi:piggyBac transposable element-derived protein 3 [Trichonephila inaurata madagascariensis]|uniref:PiggyBac transposable element-derived protein 3 n=1 Tax=Trichonephila inaurata madagascariensis TaxID=2747483 RepID=A0A8X6WVS6_9ARAC|nr:piggyBac transposable element-derived protein 3 [Trichonephila inaurata madagascariensis]
MSKPKFQFFSIRSGFVDTIFEHLVTPIDFFLQFNDEDIIENIVFQTNLYITEKQNSVRPITVNEIYGFIGLQFLFGYHKLPRNHLYWSLDVDTSVNVVQQTMTRNRYHTISNIHPNDNLSIPSNKKDKMYKLRPFLSRLNENFKKIAGWPLKFNQLMKI